MRLSRPFSFIRTLTVGFGITPNLLTLFLQGIRRGIPGEQGARGLGLVHPYRRWGISPRPENIGRPVLSGLNTSMAKGGGASKGPSRGNLHVPHAGRATAGARWQAGVKEPLTIWAAQSGPRIGRAWVAPGESDSGLFSLQKLTRTISCGRPDLVGGLSVDGVGVPLHRFRKSHHLIPAGPRAARGNAVGSGAPEKARFGLLRA
jgi:hypothetical protein